VRIAAISAAASLLLLAQHTIFPADRVPLGTPVWVAYTVLYVTGAVAAIAFILLALRSRRWSEGPAYRFTLGCSAFFMLALVALSVVDSGSETDVAGLILGIVVVGSIYRARYNYLATLIVAASALYVLGHVVVWRHVRLTGVLTAIVVTPYGLYVAAAMEASRIDAFISRRKLNRQNRVLAHLSSTDPLTGVMNRRTMEQHLDVHMDEYRRYDEVFSLVILDIDRFKLINDTHGHDVGDDVLVGIAGLLRDSIRTSDKVARYGGEEFVLILPHTRAPRAREVAERIRRLMAEIRFSGADVTVTSSFGVTEVSPNDQDVRGLVRKADAALYEAKTTGRNRVSVAGE
jgi:diguanylate cyclase (GGDEF)-like protein